MPLLFFQKGGGESAHYQHYSTYDFSSECCRLAAKPTTEKTNTVQRIIGSQSQMTMSAIFIRKSKLILTASWNICVETLYVNRVNRFSEAIRHTNSELLFPWHKLKNKHFEASETHKTGLVQQQLHCNLFQPQCSFLGSVWKEGQYSTPMKHFHFQYA